MRHRKRKWAAWLLTAGMVLGLLPAGAARQVSAAGDFDPDADLLAHYPLETDTRDVSGNQKDGGHCRRSVRSGFYRRFSESGGRRQKQRQLCDTAGRAL